MGRKVLLCLLIFFSGCTGLYSNPPVTLTETRGEQDFETSNEFYTLNGNVKFDLQNNLGESISVNQICFDAYNYPLECHDFDVTIDSGGIAAIDVYLVEREETENYTLTLGITYTHQGQTKQEEITITGDIT
jgi:hypothetical protein